MHVVVVVTEAAVPVPYSGPLHFYFLVFFSLSPLRKKGVLIFVLSCSGLDFVFPKDSSFAKQSPVRNLFDTSFMWLLHYYVHFHIEPKDLGICIYLSLLGCLPLFYLFFDVIADDSGIDGSFSFEALPTTLLAAEKEEAKAVLTLFLKKKGLSNAVAARTVNKSDIFIDHLILRLHSIHKSRYLVGSISTYYCLY